MTPTTNEQLERKIDNLQSSLSQLSTCIQVTQSQMERLIKMTEENNRALRGTNGNPGLVARVEQAEKVVHMMEGDKSTPGIIERVRDLEELQETVKKWFWLIGSAIILFLLTTLLSAIPKIYDLLKGVNP